MVVYLFLSFVCLFVCFVNGFITVRIFPDLLTHTFKHFRMSITVSCTNPCGRYFLEFFQAYYILQFPPARWFYNMCSNLHGYLACHLKTRGIYFWSIHKIKILLLLLGFKLMTSIIQGKHLTLRPHSPLYHTTVIVSCLTVSDCPFIYSLLGKWLMLNMSIREVSMYTSAVAVLA